MRLDYVIEMAAVRQDWMSSQRRKIAKGMNICREEKRVKKGEGKGRNGEGKGEKESEN